jgi:hypothetical protein
MFSKVQFVTVPPLETDTCFETKLLKGKLPDCGAPDG